jgi:hypothetical protein
LARGELVGIGRGPGPVKDLAVKYHTPFQSTVSLWALKERRSRGERSAWYEEGEEASEERGRTRHDPIGLASLLTMRRRRR